MTTPFAPFLADHPVTVHRGGLPRTLRAIQQGRLRVGFIGGSITALHPPTWEVKWPEGVTRWFNSTYPDLRLRVDNVAIGATGTDLGVFRAQRDLLDRDCDLVFVEYAVNDNPGRRLPQEGLVRKLLAEQRDVVFCYTFAQFFYEDIAAGRVPETIRVLDEIAAHYHIGSVWMGVHAINEVRAGRMRWEEWLPDGVHPSAHGGACYAESVNAFLRRELIEKPGAPASPFGAQRPAPLDPANWESAVTLPLDQARLTGPWALRRSPYWWCDEVLETAAVGARMEIDFEGRALCLGFCFGKSSSEFRYRIDGGEWTTTNRDRPYWCPETDWFRLDTLTDSLAPGRHRAEIEVIHGNQTGCTGTNFRLGLIGVVK